MSYSSHVHTRGINHPALIVQNQIYLFLCFVFEILAVDVGVPLALKVNLCQTGVISSMYIDRNTLSFSLKFAPKVVLLKCVTEVM